MNCPLRVPRKPAAVAQAPSHGGHLEREIPKMAAPTPQSDGHTAYHGAIPAIVGSMRRAMDGRHYRLTAIVLMPEQVHRIPGSSGNSRTKGPLYRRGRSVNSSARNSGSASRGGLQPLTPRECHLIHVTNYESTLQESPLCHQSHCGSRIAHLLDPHSLPSEKWAAFPVR
jgi:hypothetical protein